MLLEPSERRSSQEERLQPFVQGRPMLLWTAVLLFGKSPSMGNPSWGTQDRKSFQKHKVPDLTFPNSTLPWWTGMELLSEVKAAESVMLRSPEDKKPTSAGPFPPPVLSTVSSPGPCEESLGCQTKLYPQRAASQLLFSFRKDGCTLQDRSFHPELCILEVKEGHSGLYWCEAAPEGGRVQKQPVCPHCPSCPLRDAQWIVPLYLLWPLPSQIPAPAPGREQCTLYANVHHQKENDEDVIYSVMCRTSKKNEESKSKQDSPSFKMESRRP
ncbi:Fc receptor-like protein 6 [Lemur catta]|uniref:Fc receptor-like protein 6 n=1 Tax=Lemur catta TaxID=9447 RepID=UPI001E266CD8|nr:Fc receptor-like protein 6 [Lemur catta]